MNFFAHSIIAARRSSNPRWVLGSMLPDFFTMAGVRLESVNGDQHLVSGIQFHHLTDEVFHSIPVFEEMMASATRALLDEGMDKGPAMAIGHAGVELLLDGVLVNSAHGLADYRTAIDELEHMEEFLHFEGGDDFQGINKWRRLTRFLPTAPIPENYAETDFVAERLIRILSGRPYLTVPENQQPLVFAWAKKAAPDVRAKAAKLLAEVEKGLSARAG